MKPQTCKRCHRRLSKTHRSGMGPVCERKVKTQVLDSDLTFGPSRFGAQYAGR